jgi:hypothetical protein
VKKHELKERHCREEEYLENKRKKPAKPSEIEMLLTSFRSLKDKESVNDHQLEKELLRDIRENMFEEKINRIKKDANHRKIVQMR